MTRPGPKPKPPSEHYVRRQFSMPRQDSARLDEIARERGMPASQVLVDLIRRVM